MTKNANHIPFPSSIASLDVCQSRIKQTTTLLHLHEKDSPRNTRVTSNRNVASRKPIASITDKSRFHNQLSRCLSSRLTILFIAGEWRLAKALGGVNRRERQSAANRRGPEGPPRSFRVANTRWPTLIQQSPCPRLPWACVFRDNVGGMPTLAVDMLFRKTTMFAANSRMPPETSFGSSQPCPSA